MGASNKVTNLEISSNHNNNEKKKQRKTKRKQQKEEDYGSSKVSSGLFEHLFGFRLEQLSSWSSIITLLSRPMDPASLALTRILFGFLMMIDILHERGMTRLNDIWGSSSTCHFPLFDFLQPPPLFWMYATYVLMFTGALGMALGLFYHIASLAFVLTYWYIHLLDTIAWNNHSYLFGILGTLLLFTDAHHSWSLDAIRNSKIKNTHVPLWNYAAFRTQIFLVYFIAGLKKTDRDWIGGYSMRYLSSHWVFLPFRVVLSDETIDYYIVHLFGFTFDLSVGFFMFFDSTRSIAFAFCAAFNLMNSQIFNIGMFPFVMLATMPIFCRPDWPRWILRRFFHRRHTIKLQRNERHCLYSDPLRVTCHRQHKTKKSPSSIRYYHKMAAAFTIVHICLQLFLPYSHFITQGYNHWSNGLYGYSWDMMVHNWNTQHIRVTVVDKVTRDIKFVNPDMWVRNNRWTHHPRLAQQYARCVERNVKQYVEHDVEIYLDVWGSLNQRFEQRIFDPHTDILTAEWSPFRVTNWTLPILEELSSWRNALIRLTERYRQSLEYVDVAFVADFPGFTMENSMNSNTSNILEVLNGKLLLETAGKRNKTLQSGDKIKLPVNQVHKIHTVSTIPACFVYVSKNANTQKY